MAERRRVLLDGAVVDVERRGDLLHAADGRTVGVDDAVHLPPVVPTKIICCHLNHISRVREFGTTLPPAPTYFHKPVSALNAHGGAVVRPANCEWLNYEGEVAIVIGTTCRNIAYADAGDHIAGYTIANDFGLHDFRDTDAGSMLRVKGADTLCPLGPGLVTDWDFRGRSMRTPPVITTFCSDSRYSILFASAFRRPWLSMSCSRCTGAPSSTTRFTSPSFCSNSPRSARIISEPWSMRTSPLSTVMPVFSLVCDWFAPTCIGCSRSVLAANAGEDSDAMTTSALALRGKLTMHVRLEFEGFCVEIGR